MTVSRVELRADDGVRLSSTWSAPDRAGDGGVLLLPGYWRRAESPRLRALAEDLARRHPVLTLDFRGHGRSSGAFTFGASEHLDVEAALREMARRGLKSVVLVGLSMGGASAIVTASRPGLPVRAAGVLAIAAPSDFRLIRPAPWRGRRDVAWSDAWRLPRTSLSCAWNDKLAPSAHVARLQDVPLRLIHAREDWLVHHEHGERLHRASSGAELLLLDEHGLHADELLGRAPELMMRLVRPFVAAALAGAAEPGESEGEAIDPAPWLPGLRELVADPARQSPDLGGIPLAGPLDSVRAVSARDGAHLALLVGGRPAWARGLRDGSAHGLNLLATQLVADGASWSAPIRTALRRALLDLTPGAPPDVTRWLLLRRGSGGLEARAQAARP